MDLLQQLLFCLCFTPLSLLWGGCCCDTIICPHCVGDAGQSQYLLEMADIANGSCSRCTVYNGAWLVDYLGNSPATLCTWRYPTLVLGCSSLFVPADSIHFFVLEGDGTIKLQAGYSSPPVQMFEEDLSPATEVDCDFDRDLAPRSPFVPCDLSIATCHVGPPP